MDVCKHYCFFANVLWNLLKVRPKLCIESSPKRIRSNILFAQMFCPQTFRLWSFLGLKGSMFCQTHFDMKLQTSFITTIVFVLFDLILYIPVTNFSVMSGRVFLGWTSTKQGFMCLAHGHNAVTPVRLKPAATRSSSLPLSHCAP